MSERKNLFTGNKDVDIMILNKLDDKDLVNVFQVDKYAKKLSDKDSFWCNRIVSRFPNSNILEYKPEGMSCSNYYIKYVRYVDGEKLKQAEEIINSENAKEYLSIGSGRNPSLETVLVSLGKGADPNTRYYLGGTALMFSAMHPARIKITKLLLDSGADPNLIAQDNNTALRTAKTHRNKEAEELLSKYLH